jgi:hypothetical protein
MSQPVSSMVVTNNTLAPVTFGGPNPQTIPVGENATWPSAEMPPLCADVNFRAAFLAGGIAVAVNGVNLPQTMSQVHTFLDNIANNVIVLT